jgi:hypothetical protein
MVQNIVQVPAGYWLPLIIPARNQIDVRKISQRFQRWSFDTTFEAQLQNFAPGTPLLLTDTGLLQEFVVEAQYDTDKENKRLLDTLDVVIPIPCMSPIRELIVSYLKCSCCSIYFSEIGRSTDFKSE